MTEWNGSAGDVDVVIVGGGAAGLNAATVLARARRSVVVIDAAEPRNAPADGVHSYLGRDGMPPAELYAAGRGELESYGGVVLTGTATDVRRDGRGFRLEVGEHERLSARRILIATGLTDQLPDIPGVRERWGRDVIHCPYCHGWEFRDRPIGVLGTGPMAIHQAQLLRQWSADVVLFLHGIPDPDAEQARALDARGIQVIRGPVQRLEVGSRGITGVRLADGQVIARDAIVVGPRMVAESPLLESLGVQPVEHEMGIGRYYPSVDWSGRTEAPGVWVAGNVTDIVAGVITAAAQGLAAASMINADLIAEDTADALAASAA